LVLALKPHNRLALGTLIHVLGDYFEIISNSSTTETLEIAIPTVGRGSFYIHKKRFNFTKEGITLD